MEDSVHLISRNFQREALEEILDEEDDLLPTWEGVKKGGALWNRQFQAWPGIWASYLGAELRSERFVSILFPSTHSRSHWIG